MKPLYGQGKKISSHVNIIPAEALTGDDIHDLAVCCAIWTAGGLMKRRELEIVADKVRAMHPNYPAQVAQTCKKIVENHFGYIHFVCTQV